MINEEIRPDGSDRQFCRIIWSGRPAVEIIPGPAGGIQEASSFFYIGKHLLSKGVPAPEIFSFEKDTGRLIVEDLGHTRFYEKVVTLLNHKNYTELLEAYRQGIDILCHMQVLGRQDFDTSWCWQEPVYDARLALEKECFYFLNAFLLDYLGFKGPCQGLEHELQGLAAMVDDVAGEKYFLHRDFQSRNIMIKNGQMKIIDFQAGRLGPRGYDLAAFLHDPYPNIPWEMRMELFDYYCAKMKELDENFSRQVFELQFHLLSILRLLQALGAYGFLIGTRQKDFFRPFIRPALSSLQQLVDSWHETRCRDLSLCVHQLLAGLG